MESNQDVLEDTTKDSESIWNKLPTFVGFSFYDVTGDYFGNGQWVVKNILRGDKMNFKDANKMEFETEMDLVLHSVPKDANNLLLRKVGKSGVQYVEGTIDQTRKRLNLRGIEKYDPHAFFDLAEYELELDDDDATLSGISPWGGQTHKVVFHRLQARSMT